MFFKLNISRWTRAAALLGSLVLAQPGQAKPAAECAFSFFSDDKIEDILRLNGGVPGPERLCRLLAAKGIVLNIVAGSGVLADRSYGWVSVSLMRGATKVDGSARSVTVIGQEANTPAADRALLGALEAVLTSIDADPDTYVRSLENEEARLRRVFGSPAR